MTGLARRRLDLTAIGSWTIFDHIFGVSRLPGPGETVTITSPIREIGRTYWGGCAPNNAVTAARLGFRSGLLMVAGHDFEEEGYRRYLEAAGVDICGVQVLLDGMSGHSFLFSDPKGDSICISHLGVAGRQEEIPPDLSLPRESSAVLLNYRFDRFALLAGEAARAEGALVATSGNLNTSSMPERFVAIADVLIANRFEMNHLARRLGVGEMHGLLKLGPHAVVVTAGAEGALVLTQDGEEPIPAVAARAVVDPTGAGDAFAGAMLAVLARGGSIPVAVRIGATTASFVVEARGCQTNLPTWERMVGRYSRAFGEDPLPLVNSTR